jgi:signal peptidase I
MGAIKAGIAPLPQIEFDSVRFREFIFGPRPHHTLARVLVWSLLTITFFHHLLVPIQIIGSSMSPTYHSGSLNLINRWSYSKHPPTRGDVIALQADDEMLLKRIVALPGETIAIVDGELQVNGVALADQFSAHKIPWEMDPIHLRGDEYFVIGDNRAASVFCKVDKEDILGKVVF